MKGTKGLTRKGLILVMVAVLMMGLATVSISCGSSDTEEAKESGSTKLPQGVTGESMDETAVAQESDGDEDSSTETAADDNSGTEKQSTTTSPMTATNVVDAKFTVVSAKREDSNADVISDDEREVKGDYMEIELTIENVGDELINLSEYSFRLESSGIEADTYALYYGDVVTYGAYVSEEAISAVLLSYSDLEPVDYKVKIEEVVDKVFLFFDLNPESTLKNESVTKDNSDLIIQKISGSETAEEDDINLADYSD